MEFLYESNRIYMNDEAGNLLAEVLFPIDEQGVYKITRTFVDSSLRGQGLAGRLVKAAANQIRTNHGKVIPVCSYAVNWFRKHPAEADILKD